MNVYEDVLRSEDGSAIVEFVILAIPLFLPLVIYLTSIHQSATVQSDLLILARQSARAYVTSPSSDYVESRLNVVLDAFSQQVLSKQGILEVPSLTVSCESDPCLTPNSQVKVVATLMSPARSFSGILRFLALPAQVFSASDVQVVDAWR